MDNAVTSTRTIQSTAEVVATPPRGAKGWRRQGTGEPGIAAVRAGEAEKLLSIVRCRLGSGGEALASVEGLADAPRTALRMKE